MTTEEIDEFVQSSIDKKEFKRTMKIETEEYLKEYSKKILRAFIIGAIILIGFVFSISYLLFAQECYVLPIRSDLQKEFFTIIQSQMGLRETGNNRGQHVDNYNKSTGVAFGSPYCASAPYWCYSEAVKKLKLATSDIPIRRTGLANGAFDAAKQKGTKSQYQDFSKGDHLIYKSFNSNSGHFTTIKEVGKNGNVTTWEFNTSPNRTGNQREGDGNFEKQRNIYHPTGRMGVRGIIKFNKQSAG